MLGVWQPGAAAAGLVGLKYHPGQTPLLSREWTSDAVGAGVIASPVLSADGSTVYVNGRDQRLWALHAADGKVKWSVPLGFLAQTPPAVTPEGLIVSGGGPDTRLAAFKDAGDHAEQAWRRDDVTPLSSSSLAGAGVGYTVVSGPAANGAPGMSLLVFDPGNGHTLNSYPLPAATGYPVGVSVGTIAGWWPPPATARCTASRRPDQPQPSRCGAHNRRVPTDDPPAAHAAGRPTSPRPSSC